MSRLLFWIAIAILVVMAVRSKLRSLMDDGQPAAPGPDTRARAGAGTGSAQAQVAEVERMACCAGCGLHFPASEAVVADGREYCSAAHARVASH